jgi:hypothetical protein
METKMTEQDTQKTPEPVELDDKDAEQVSGGRPVTPGTIYQAPGTKFE